LRIDVTSSSQHLNLDSSAEATPSWKQEVNERLAAHRTRRTRKPDNHPRLPLGLENSQPPLRGEDTASVAARVAARYANAPTYSEMLAAEARAAAEAADAAVNAARKAQEAAQAVLISLDQATEANAAQSSIGQSAQPGPSVANSRPTLSPETTSPRQPAPPVQAQDVTDPLEEALVVPPQPLAANLIEFPRELVAARKARPRLAEGPLRDEPGTPPEKAQLRIFEVEADSISNQPIVHSGPTEWSSIRLDEQPQPERDGSGAERLSSASLDLPLQAASIEDRLMAAIVDMALILAAFLLFVLVFAACTTHPPSGKPALAGAAVVLASFAVLYQLLFFRYAGGTPGMRYAKIALCTFGDENPTRKAMCRRVAALALSLCPLGLGCLWAFFDEDRLGWHDRLTRMYQRSYR
jgi:uncharacterized RDD family membrane protein YckC